MLLFGLLSLTSFLTVNCAMFNCKLIKLMLDFFTVVSLSVLRKYCYNVLTSNSLLGMNFTVLSLSMGVNVLHFYHVLFRFPCVLTK